MSNIGLQLNVVTIVPDGILPHQRLTGNRHWPPQPSCYIPYAPFFIICSLVKLALESQNYPNGNECERKGGREVMSKGSRCTRVDFLDVHAEYTLSGKVSGGRRETNE